MASDVASVSDRVLNINVGIVGHVDSGKTSLARVLSTHLSTASLDKAPQSQQRGITLDLGFSAFYLPPAPHLASVYSRVRYTLVDCPGHASLLRTIIGGAAIIDVMLLVIDATKGIQTQTAECLVLGELLVKHMIVVVNKADLLTADAQRNKLERGLRATFKATKFGGDLPIVWTSCPPATSSTPPSVAALLSALSASLTPPSRKTSAPLYLPIDHCFPIRGQGTVLTGTIITGSVAPGDTVELPSLRQQRKVKSLQMFHQDVQRAEAGDRVALCVVGLDAAEVERGLVCSAGSVVACDRVVVWAEKVRFYKEAVSTGQQLHCSIGHDTVVATCTFFAPSPAAESSHSGPDGAAVPSPLPLSFDPSLPYLHLAALPATPCFAVLTFPHAVYLPSHVSPVVIASHLNTPYTTTACRIAFSACIVPPLPLPSSCAHLQLYKPKAKDGVVDRIGKDGEVIGRGMFRSTDDVARYVGMRVEVEGAGTGTVEGGFGKGGKFRLRMDSGSGAVTAGAKLVLRYNQFLPDASGKKRTVQ